MARYLPPHCTEVLLPEMTTSGAFQNVLEHAGGTGRLGQHALWLLTSRSLRDEAEPQDFSLKVREKACSLVSRNEKFGSVCLAAEKSPVPRSPMYLLRWTFEKCGPLSMYLG